MSNSFFDLIYSSSSLLKINIWIQIRDLLSYTVSCCQDPLRINQRATTHGISDFVVNTSHERIFSYWTRFHTIYYTIFDWRLTFSTISQSSAFWQVINQDYWDINRFSINTDEYRGLDFSHTSWTYCSCYRYSEGDVHLDQMRCFWFLYIWECFS
jgi:hypothetical protein